MAEQMLWSVLVWERIPRSSRPAQNTAGKLNIHLVLFNLNVSFESQQEWMYSTEEKCNLIKLQKKSESEQQTSEEIKALQPFIMTSSCCRTALHDVMCKWLCGSSQPPSEAQLQIWPAAAFSAGNFQKSKWEWFLTSESVSTVQSCEEQFWWVNCVLH